MKPQAKNNYYLLKNTNSRQTLYCDISTSYILSIVRTLLDILIVSVIGQQIRSTIDPKMPTSKACKLQTKRGRDHPNILILCIYIKEWKQRIKEKLY